MHAHLPSRVQTGAVTPSVILSPDTAEVRPNAPTDAVRETLTQRIEHHREMQKLCIDMARHEPVNADYWINEARIELAIVKALRGVA